MNSLNLSAALFRDFDVSPDDFSDAYRRAESCVNRCGVTEAELGALVISALTTSCGAPMAANVVKSVLINLVSNENTASALKVAGLKKIKPKAIDTLLSYSAIRDNLGQPLRDRTDIAISGAYNQNVFRTIMLDVSSKEGIYFKALKSRSS